MAKILISSLGAGSLDRNNAAARAYRTAKYRMNDSDKDYEKSFIASVLYEHLELDGIIFIGTVKSMWEEVYRAFAQETGKDFHEDEWIGLAEQIEKLDLNSSLDSLDLSPVETVLGDRSKCILIKYGLNEAELQENLDRIFKIVDYLEAGDELYIDITHSFRSLSIFLFIVLIFLNDLEQERNIKIKGVFYGMLDVIREVGHAPVVDLKSLFDLTQWIKGAYSLKEFGNGYLISQLLDEQGETELANRIEALSEAININYVPTIRERSIDLKTSLKSQGLSSPFKHLRNILEKFTQQFSKRSEPESVFQLKLAKWYFDNKRYATGYITLAEAIITYLCEQHEQDIRSESARNKMKTLLHENSHTALAKLYFKVNPTRNAIAHALIDSQRSSYTNAIKNAKSYHKQAEDILKSGTMG
ncbi:TIGR02221 family CRISPR-associated protein [Roseofilum sp. BLCC_M154]|uniref:TIGR02221 family CRISPR-associated protein n=1 Tax=Roseofilum acuticapitatum BLCC-M154 TaxID=3022444 RepID=A0ABT7APS9_9CYAN|nr:TIGR02221 family CRISPR-associated protein [Roseofilum acuticapitatum]MDJ1168903.1 TIGR02221 family CRISPR-associated protein [Roseofilum acuticapitatum BLCC-M154]